MRARASKRAPKVNVSQSMKHKQKKKKHKMCIDKLKNVCSLVAIIEPDMFSCLVSSLSLGLVHIVLAWRAKHTASFWP